jgi:hypothetical protein
MTRWYELTKPEQTRRLLQAQEGLVCFDCGKSLLNEPHYDEYTCDDCFSKAHAGEDVDYWEDRSYDEDGTHVRLISRDTGKCFSEYTVVEIYDEGIPEVTQQTIAYYKSKYKLP